MEDLKISKSEFLPTITIKGSKSSEDTSKLTNQNGTNATITDVNPETRSVKIEQKTNMGIIVMKLKGIKHSLY